MSANRQIREKRAAEVRNMSFNVTSYLSSAETITGTPTIVASPTGPTFASVAVNTATYVEDQTGDTIAIGKAVQCRASGGTAGVLYELTVTFTTSATLAETIIPDVWALDVT